MCDHPAEKISFIAGSGQMFPTGEAWKFDDIWYCGECGESFDHDPADDLPEDFEFPLDLEEEPEEDLRKELSSELF